MIFEGRARLVHDSEEEGTLNPYECDAFDGGADIYCKLPQGHRLDTVMLRKGGTGSMKAIANIRKSRVCRRVMPAALREYSCAAITTQLL